MSAPPTSLVIAVSGDPGSGKTTVCAPLAAHLGIRRIYFGQIVREMAARRGISLMEFAKILEEHPEIDEELEALQIVEAKRGSVLLEGRMSAWAITTAEVQGLKIYLSARPEVQVERLHLRDGGTAEQNRLNALARQADLREKFKQFYGVDFMDPALYDCTVDTSDRSPREVYDALLAEVRSYQERVGLPVSPEGGWPETV